MTTTTDLGSGRGWLNADAAQSVFRIDAALGRALQITSAGRTLAQQQALINRWNAGGTANRPPNLYQPAMPASASPHVKGNALDTNEHAWMIANGPAFGWFHDVASDYVHFVYHPDRDSHAGGGTGVQGTLWDQQRLNAWAAKDGAAALTEDGVRGPLTIARIKDFQSKHGLVVDGIAGPATDGVLGQDPNPTPQPAPVPVAGNRFGLADVKGLQKVARLYGYTGGIDNVWGSGSEAGFDRFLSTHWRGNLAAWLRAKYRYVGNDVYGPLMQAALARANAANEAAL